jgi:hypothetical protein
MSIEYYLTYGIEYFVTWRNILPHVVDEQYYWMKKMFDKSNG